MSGGGGEKVKQSVMREERGEKVKQSVMREERLLSCTCLPAIAQPLSASTAVHK